MSYLEKSMEAWFLFLTADNGLLANFKEVDEGRVGFYQLLRLEREEEDRADASKIHPHIQERGSTGKTQKHFLFSPIKPFPMPRLNEWELNCIHIVLFYLTKRFI